MSINYISGKDLKVGLMFFIENDMGECQESQVKSIQNDNVQININRSNAYYQLSRDEFDIRNKRKVQNDEVPAVASRADYDEFDWILTEKQPLSNCTRDEFLKDAIQMAINSYSNAYDIRGLQIFQEAARKYYPEIEI